MQRGLAAPSVRDTPTRARAASAHSRLTAFLTRRQTLATFYSIMTTNRNGARDLSTALLSEGGAAHLV